MPIVEEHFKNLFYSFEPSHSSFYTMNLVGYFYTGATSPALFMGAHYIPSEPYEDPEVAIILLLCDPRVHNSRSQIIPLDEPTRTQWVPLSPKDDSSCVWRCVMKAQGGQVVYTARFPTSMLCQRTSWKVYAGVIPTDVPYGILPHERGKIGTSGEVGIKIVRSIEGHLLTLPHDCK
jgi:hypothetical protein